MMKSASAALTLLLCISAAVALPLFDLPTQTIGHLAGVWKSGIRPADDKFAATVGRHTSGHLSPQVIDAGDIAIISINTDDNDQFSFVALDDIPANTVITFTDNPWTTATGPFGSSEGYCEWTHSTVLKAGTVVSITGVGTSWNTSVTATVGTIIQKGGSPAFSTTGDQIIAFADTWANRPTSETDTRFLYALSSTGFITAGATTANSSYVPAVLSGSNTSFAAESDNQYFANGTLAQVSVSATDTKSTLLSTFTNGDSLWHRSNTLLTFPTYSITVLADEPGLSPMNPTFSGISAGQFTVNLSGGDGTSRLVVARAIDPPTADPVDGTTYNANSVFGSGSTVGGGFVVYKGADSSFTLTGLSSGTTYVVNVYSFNGVDATNPTSGLRENYRTGGGIGQSSQATTAGGLPVAITNAASAVTTTSATLNGTGNPNNVDTTGWFRYSSVDPVTCNDSFGTRAPVSGGDALGSGTSLVPFNEAITGLTPGTTYYVCAIAQNGVGTALGAPVSFTTLGGLPVAITNAASAITTTSAQLNGTGNPNNVDTTGWFRYSTTSPGTCNDVFGTRAPGAGGDSLGSGTSLVPFNEAITGLTPSTTYYVCAIAQNSVGTALGALQQFTTAGVPIMGTSQTSLSFGGRQIGTTSTAQSFTISNTGSGDLSYSFATTGDSDQFVITGTTPNTIAPGGLAQIDVQFAPTAPLGLKTATITIIGNDPANTTDTVTLTGTANNIGTFTLSSATYQANEDAGVVQLTVNRTNGTLGTVQVTVNYGGVTATGGTFPCAAGQDYVDGSTTLTFLQGDTSHTASLVLCDDAVPEDSETLTATITASGGATIFPTQTATVTILDTDPRTRVVDRPDDNVSADECTGAANDCSLRGAIATANDGDTIVFDFGSFLAGHERLQPQQTLTLTSGQLSLNADVTITGPGASQLTIDGGGLSRIFDIAANTIVAMSGMTLANGNAGAGNGGAIIVNAGSNLNLNAMVITDNDASVGGGVYAAGAALIVTDSTFSNNDAVNSGGGIYFAGGGFPFTVTNSTFSANTASAGGGIWTITANAGVVNHSTFSGSGIYNDDAGIGSTLPLNNTILTGGGCTGSGFTDGGYNIEFGATCGFSVLNNSKPNTDPMLGPLQDNGGPTFTMALLPGSPAIDQGTSLGWTTDQRGMPRPTNITGISDADDGSDIGAFEVMAPTAAPASVSGRVRSADGRGLRAAVVTLTDETGGVRQVVTNSFGYFRFSGVPAGATYVMGVRSKQFRFSPQIISVTEDVAGLEIYPDPQ